jgi:hypothetical protein
MAGKWFAKGVVFALAFSGAISIPSLHASGGGDNVRGDVSCWFGPLPEGLDPCGLLAEARDLLGRLPQPVENDVNELAAGLDIERSLPIQQRLLREHLAWLDDGLTEKQLGLMVFLTVAVSLDRAQEQVIAFHEALEVEAEPKLEQRLRNVELYRRQSLLLLTELSRELKDISDRELKLRF